MKSKSTNGKDFMARVLRLLAKGFVAIVLILIMGITIVSVAPIYDFGEGKPFVGPDIYNPYKGIDTVTCWKRANFHTHSRVEGLLNECNYWPNEVVDTYESLGYDIVTFSNHNELTNNPKGSNFQANAYEHGYNLFKFHKLTFGVKEVWHFDHLFPIFASQKQFQLTQLAESADVVQLNHPLRTPTLSEDQMEQLSGYKLIELDSGKSTENEYWDRALSAGRYSFGVANDDLHHPDKSYKIARRCNFLATPSAKYDDILKCLTSGGFYAMRLPDYGDGDWAIKRAKNKTLPRIEGISLRDSVIFVRFSQPAETIKVIGQNHTTLSTVERCDSLTYTMKASDSYARITAYFPEGEVIYTNPFARYDASQQRSPFDVESPKVDIFLTILFNLMLLVVCIADGFILYKYIIKR